MRHWTENDFKEWLYGLKDADPHLEECAECRGESDRLRMARARTMEQPEISQEFLAAQRRSIYRRLYEPRHAWLTLRWALPALLVLLMAVGVTLQRGRRSAATISDEQLFSDLTAIEQSAEPKAIAPMHKLFEE
jgi:predicted anti-sigma-YlaC factor YlaD